MMSLRRWWAVPLVLGCLLLGALSSGKLLAQDKTPAAPPDRGELDANIYKALRTVINDGAYLYNSGEWAACYHLYQGALLGLKPVLESYRPALAKEIDQALVAAGRSPQVGDRAFVLREVMNKIRAETAPMVAKPKQPPTPPAPPKSLTLWDRLGGEKGVSRVVDNFLTSSLADPKVNFYRKPNVNPTPEQIATLKKQLVELLSSMTGGPYDYKGKSMKDAHKGMGITNPQFDAMIGHIRAALLANGAQPADITLVLDIVESTRKDIVQPTPPPPPPPPATVWLRLGGEPGATRIVDAFVKAAIADPKVNFFRDPKNSPSNEQVIRIKKGFVDQLSTLSGGPLLYKGMSMKLIHAGMGITNAEFDAFLGHIRAALKAGKVSDADIKTLMGKYEETRKDVISMPSTEPEPKPEEKKPAPPEAIGKPTAVPEEKKPEETKPEEEPELLKNLPEVKNPE